MDADSPLKKGIAAENHMAGSAYEVRMKSAYEAFSKSITIGREHDTRARFIQHFIAKGLGYPEQCYLNEQDWSDIWLLERPPSKDAVRRSREDKINAVLPVAIIETKDINVEDEKLISQANLEQTFSYPLRTRGATQYVGLTNFRRLIIWPVTKNLDPSAPPRPIADVNLKEEIKTKVLASRLGELSIITFEEVNKTYANFDVCTNYDLADPLVFEAFTAVVKWKILDETFIPVLNSLARQLEDVYESFSKQLAYLKSLRERGTGLANGVSATEIDRRMRLLEEQNRACSSFRENFDRWNRGVYSPTSSASLDQRILRFASETAYTILSRMLLVKIAESKGLLRQKISDGGLINAISLISQINEAFKEVLRLAFRDARGSVYEHLFLDGIYDWYWEKDGELNNAIRKTLWYLNQYDFDRITRDVFKHVYQFHMDKRQRKLVGEYYTPDPIVNYILDKVGYVSQVDLRQTRLIDLGCGSGTFLVEAVNRLKHLYLGLSPKEILYMVAGRSAASRELGSIFGFDIIPFAAYLAEANLLFQLIDEIKSAKSGDPQFRIDKFQIYRTNSLQPPAEVASMDDWVVGIESAEVSKVKQLKFDFVVGNPPYVEVENLRDKKTELVADLRNMFPELLEQESLGRLELYVAFLAVGVLLTGQDGKLGFITSAKFLATDNGRWVRRLILENCVIEEIVDLMRVSVFPDQGVYPMIIVLRKQNDRLVRQNNLVKVKVILRDKLEILDQVKHLDSEDPTQAKAEIDHLVYTVPQREFEQSPDFVFPIYLSRSNAAIREKIFHGDCDRVPLSQLLDIRQGVIIGENKKWERRLGKLGLKNFGKDFVVRESELESVPRGERTLYVKMVDGDTVGHFDPDWKSHRTYLCYDREWFTRPRERDVFEQPEKVLLKVKTKYLQASYDDNQLFCTNDVYVARWQISPVFKTNIKYLVGLLNSKVLDFCYKLRHAEYLRGGWFVRYGHVYGELPVVRPTKDQEKRIVELVDKLIAARKKSRDTAETSRSLSAVVEASRVIQVTAGLSKLIAGRKNDAGTIVSIACEKSKVYFDRSRRTYIECPSEETALFVSRIFSENFSRIRGQPLSDVLSNEKLPRLERDLDVILRLERKLIRQSLDADNEFSSLLKMLDRQVGLLYGLSEKELDELCTFLQRISGEEQAEPIEKPILKELAPSRTQSLLTTENIKS